jgi:4-amino-4-deoxy-L-arabinose transferase-like glycosyltransferase
VSALVGRQIGKSKAAGLVAGLMAAVWPLLVDASRRGMANAPWLFFTLLTFVFLYQARDRKRIALLYSALIAGVLSFLFKYQTGVILILPFIYAFVYFRGLKARLIGHLAIWSAALLALALWLVLYYNLFDMVNLPGNGDIGRVAVDGRLIGFQSLTAHLGTVADRVGEAWFLWAAGAAVVLAFGALTNRKLAEALDAGLTLSLALFTLLFYLLMSLAPPSFTHPIYWIPAVSAIYLLAIAGAVATARAGGYFISKTSGGKWSRTLRAAPLVALVVFSWPFVQSRTTELAWTYQHVWSKPPTNKLLDEWFSRRAPQGGRVVVEGMKMPLNYVYAPAIFHKYVVDSIFADSVENYRARGYEYLIWNSMTSNPTDTLADLETEQNKAYLKDVKEVLRLTGENVAGADIVVYQIPPLQQHPLYFWFGNAISFRGFDLNSDAFKPGDDLQLVLYWMSAEKTPANYIVFVHVLAADGTTLLAGQDGPPDYGNRPTWSWAGDMQLITDQRLLTIPLDAPPGAYTLRVGLYDADTSRRLPIFDLQRQPVGDNITLAEIHVQK